MTGLTAVSLVAGTGWSSGVKPSPPLESAQKTEVVDTRATLFPWIGI